MRYQDIRMQSRESSSHWSLITHLMRPKQPTENTTFLTSTKTGVRKHRYKTRNIPSLPGKVYVFAFLK